MSRPPLSAASVGADMSERWWQGVARYTAQGAVLASAFDLAIRLLQAWLTPGLHVVDPYAVLLAPLGAAAILLPAMLGTAGVRSLLGRRPADMSWLRVLAYSFAFLQPLLGDRLYIGASLALAVGLGIQTARLVERSTLDRLMRRVTIVTAAALLLSGIALTLSRGARGRASTDAPESLSRDRPNVLLLILDTVGAREMSLYGYERSTTTVIDSLARHGVVFDRAIVGAPWTLPSHASLFTGLRADRLPTRFLAPLDRKERVVAEELAEAGYATGAFVANLEYTTRESGLSRGFQSYVDFRPSWSALASIPLARLLIDQVNRVLDRPLQLGRKHSGEVTREFLSWHDTIDDRPWFAFLNYYDAHDPYVPPQGEERRFLGAGREAIYNMDALTAADSQKVASARALHDAALFSLDREVGHLLDELRRRGALDRTVIVLSSDHGEEWGELGVLRHGNSVYPRALHVPLILVHPGQIPAGQRVSHVVATRRIAATILELAGLPTNDLPGPSLVAEWQGGPALADSVVSWVEKGIRQPNRYPASRTALYSVITDSLQIIIGADTLVLDPWSSFEIPRRVPIDSARDALARAIQRIRRLP